MEMTPSNRYFLLGGAYATAATKTSSKVVGETELSGDQSRIRFHVCPDVHLKPCEIRGRHPLDHLPSPFPVMDGRYGFVLRNMQYPPPPYPPPMVNTAYNQLGEADNPPGQVTRNGQYRNTPLQATEPPAPVQGHSFLFDSFSNVVLDTPVDEGLDGLQRGLGFSSASPSQTQSSPMHMQGESFQNPGIMGVLIPPPVPPDNHLGMHLIPPQITPIHAKTGKISSRLKQPLSLRPEVELRAPWLLLYYNKKGGEPPSTALLDTVLEQESTITKCTFPRCEKTYKSKSKIPASAHYHVLRHIGYRPCECPAPDCNYASYQTGDLNTHIEKCHLRIRKGLSDNQEVLAIYS